MLSPRSLLAVAHDLARLDPRRPRQASLRRAVSTAYYATFHLLIQTAVKSFIGFGPRPTHREISESVVRWFTHERLAEACRQFAGPVVPSKLRSVLPPLARAEPTSAELQRVARIFLELQRVRHRADYDPAVRFARQDVLKLLAQVDQAFLDWEAAASDPFRPIFLLFMLTGEVVIKNR
ncbi:MAG TPA: hypothetical protein VFJ58_19265 [Armatimonadota bacterium]|nr:hypothetical protein [Armatimonadota bacterium]